ncbi:hypothetical protein HNV10_16070 [Winogradskyella litoriviva]|uniref:SH3 domain-containing protein n=1 Tax=Winogradskyella litoriviva TaxID=1220182 RepID=A0ABX2E9N2_9FLAO|nr:hypothetical protein [Winogradskyella litoriviva]NRD24771.1 hypothetical protein [Winogradskyella litoriviva]
MLKKIIFTISFILISLFGMAQKDINNYKYIIIPKEFSFSKSEDQYQLNSLTKFLFNKHGYEAYFIDELPEDVKSDRCNGLRVSVSKEKSSMFKTKVEITVKDCYDNVVLTSKIGESRLKVYSKAYNEALRDAFETFKNLDYKYNAEEKSEAPKVVKEHTTTDAIAVKKVEKNEVKTSLEGTIKKETPKAIKENGPNKVKRELYYAQEISNGFQLVNSEPKVVMILLNTQAENVFLVKGKSAIVFKEDGFWYYSENDGELGEKQSMNIKF